MFADPAPALFESLEPRKLLSTFTVTNTGDSGAGSFRQAVLDANNAAGADVIEFDASLTWSTIALTSGDLSITDDLTINGLGDELLTISGNDSWRIFSNFATTTIRGLTLVRGAATGTALLGDGGAIHNSGDLTLIDSTVKWSAADYGGGIYNSTGALTLTNTLVTENTAYSGGGIINVNFDGGEDQFGGTVALNDSTVSSNTAEYGGAIWSSGDLSLVDSVVSNNSASRSAAGIYNAFGTLTMTRATVSGNDAGRNGGGVFNSGEATITDSTLSGNAADLGGGLYNAVGTVEAQGSLFSANTAQSSGGGIYTRTGGTVTIVVSTISVNQSSGTGGGVSALESTITLTDSTISDNTSQGDGGGLFSDGAAATLTNVRVTGNTATSGPGGGIYQDGNALVITSATISGNSAPNNHGGGLFTRSGSTVQMTDTSISLNRALVGGGFSNRGTFTLTTSTVSENTADWSSGGIRNEAGATLSLTDSTISRNTSASTGGGSDNYGDLMLLHVTVSDNEAQYGAGLFNLNTATITASTIKGNIATVSGGGIYTGLSNDSDTTLSVVSSTISGNEAQGGSGGGIYARTGTVVIANSTLSGNSASSEGGAIYNSNNGALTVTTSTVALSLGGGGLHLASGVATLKSTIVAGNIGGDVLNGTLHPASSHNLIQSAATAGGLVDDVNGNIVGEDPLLGALADNGGPTQTHALLAFSPALNNGLNETGLATDQRGSVFRRAFGGGPDIGAFERQSLSLRVSTTADEVDGDYSFGEFSLREALALANASPGVDDIGFEEILRGGSIVLGGTQLTITDDVTITGPGAQDLTLDADGGSAVFLNSAAVVTISGLTITGGGTSGIRNSDGVLTLSGVVIAGNATPGDGGGVQNTGGTLTITDSTIADNTAGNAGGGGGIFSFQGVVTITDSIISGNAAGEGGSGGGILNSLGALAITDSTVSDNTAYAGGGLQSFDGALTLTRSTVSGNSSLSQGGGIDLSGGAAEIINSTISGNHTDGNGGGISSDGVDLAISNSTIAFNAADADGDGQGAGGGVHVAVSASPGFETTSSLYATNTRAGGSLADDITLAAGSATGTNNLVQHAASAGGLLASNANLLGADPLLTGLASNGGSTRTHALLPGSPALDAGANPSGAETDQVGRSRQRGRGVDIGAFEATARPTLASLSGSAAEVSQGDVLVLTANGVEDDRSVAAVRFYADRNGDGIAQDSELLGSDTDGADGYRMALTRFQTSALAHGEVSFLAIATDNEGFTSDTATFEARVLYSLRSAAATSAASSSTSDDTLWTAIVNEAGDVVLFDTTNAISYHLGIVIGAPKSVGGVVLFTEPKDGLIYAAYPSTQGLILVQRAADGEWSTRVLVGEADTPRSSLTQFASRSRSGRTIVIAGLNANGDLVAIQQSGTQTNGQWDWESVNISDDLSAQGMRTPEFVQLISYVTPWDAWTLAGIDVNGDIQGVWIAPASFDLWRVDNLSDITGAPPISGQLTVTQTAWSAINLGGVDSNGQLVVTWWVPSFGGNWVTSNLTNVSGGETLVAGQATGFVTPWGAINYAGINQAGEVAAYWWTPQTNAWLVTPLTGRFDASASRPVGSLTSHVSDAGTMSVLGSTDDGEITRLWWTPGGGGLWRLDNLTETASRT